ncbi:unnamed protein product [Moneuplotes crassus]|uniref:Uncharacterized protein n=1 Tax=Euplotes crassus TaxID=5936 RepID=A0AAD1Y057_EUPCR|nr:unnamed protein product [Moneuplotes crassus]
MCRMTMKAVFLLIIRTNLKMKNAVLLIIIRSKRKSKSKEDQQKRSSHVRYQCACAVKNVKLNISLSEKYCYKLIFSECLSSLIYCKIGDDENICLECFC